MLDSLPQIMGAFLTGILVTLITQKSQARLSERAHSREMVRDSVAFQRQRVEKLRDWHAQQFDIATEAAKLYGECIRKMNEPEDLKVEAVHDARVKADKLIADVIHTISREPGNDFVVFRCKSLRMHFDYFEFLIECGPFLRNIEDSEDSEDGEDWDSPSPHIRATHAEVRAAITILEIAIQERLKELDSQLK